MNIWWKMEGGPSKQPIGKKGDQKKTTTVKVKTQEHKIFQSSSIKIAEETAKAIIKTRNSLR